jgi:tRNA dimethylallyltransferase
MNKITVILGPTASGKTSLAAHLAAKTKGEVLSADSRQVYKGMDIGTGKDLADFNIDGKIVPYHLIDIVDAGEAYNVFKYQQDFLTAYNEIIKREKQAILCGGTGMYIEAVLKGYRLLEVPKNISLRNELDLKSSEALITDLKSYKSLHNTSDIIEKDRLVRAIEIAQFEKENQDLIQDYPKIEAHLFGIYFEREELRKRITNRLKFRFKNEDMIGEVERLIASGISPEKLKYYGLEYKLITQFLLNEITRNELFEQLNIAIHQFSKRQTTWFRRMERNGFKINWIDGNIPIQEKLNEITKYQ